MIRYPVTLAELEKAVDAEKPNWRSRAKARTQRFQKASGYLEPPAPIWSEIKRVYMRLQHNKCAFCELKEGDHERGRIKVDVEHFRPKRQVEEWPSDQDPRKAAFGFPTGGRLNDGYYRLAYHLFNYAACCKVCNTVLKAEYFPIEGRRMPGATDPIAMQAELPLLIYPIGDWDQDPSELIEFDGTIPVPMAESGHDLHRAQVTIELFQLYVREDLQRERSEVVAGLWIALRLAETGSPEERSVARRFIEVSKRPASRHCNAARCFCRLYEQDRGKSQSIAEAAMALLESLT